MKKYLMMAVAVLAVLAVAIPSFALEMKYGGMFRVRLQSNNNVTDGNDDLMDNENYIDQRLRMYFTFVSSENLQVVTKWEADTRWGADNNGSTNFSQPPNGRQGGGDVGADAVNLEMKNAYIDFAIPNTPVRMTAGVQTLTLLSGWVVDDDFSALTATAKLDPVRVMMGYIAAKNENIMTYSENIDDFFVNVSYADGPFKASIVGIYQYGHNTNVSADPGIIGNATNVQSNYTRGAATGIVENNNVFDLGLNFEYKVPLWSAYINFVKNFGSFDNPETVLPSNTDTNFDGWMVDAGASLYCGPFTFNLNGFVTSGSDINDGASGASLTDYSKDFNSMFRYPAGVSHYWSEIMGLGSLDESVANNLNNGTGSITSNNDRNHFNRGYASSDHPSNLWMINAGAAWQALEGTKLTLNYYYIGTTQDVLANIDDWVAHGGNAGRGSSVGNELDMYVDQKIVDKLNIRLVGAYLFADEAYTAFANDDDAYEVGAVLQWSF
jgi:hypothetical protein